MLFLRSSGLLVKGAFAPRATTVRSALSVPPAAFLRECLDVLEHLIVTEVFLIVLQEDLLTPPEPHQEGERGHEPGPHSLNLVVVAQLVLGVLEENMAD